MKSLSLLFARFAHSLGIAIWLGGLIAIGALVAPTAFHVARLSSLLAGNPTGQAAIAGGIVGGSLRVFNWLCVFALVLMLPVDLAALTLRNRARSAGVTMTGILGICLAYQMAFLFPAMDAAQRAMNRSLFDSLHGIYYAISVYLQLPLLLAASLLAAWREVQYPRGQAKPD